MKFRGCWRFGVMAISMEFGAFVYLGAGGFMSRGVGHASTPLRMLLPEMQRVGRLD